MQVCQGLEAHGMLYSTSVNLTLWNNCHIQINPKGSLHTKQAAFINIIKDNQKKAGQKIPLPL